MQPRTKSHMISPHWWGRAVVGFEEGGLEPVRNVWNVKYSLVPPMCGRHLNGERKKKGNPEGLGGKLQAHNLVIPMGSCCDNWNVRSAKQFSVVSQCLFCLFVYKISGYSNDDSLILWGVLPAVTSNEVIVSQSLLGHLLCCKNVVKLLPKLSAPWCHPLCASQT